MLPLLVSSHVIGPFYDSLQVTGDLASTALMVAIILPGFLLSKYPVLS